MQFLLGPLLFLSHATPCQCFEYVIPVPMIILAAGSGIVTRLRLFPADAIIKVRVLEVDDHDSRIAIANVNEHEVMQFSITMSHAARR